MKSDHRFRSGSHRRAVAVVLAALLWWVLAACGGGGNFDSGSNKESGGGGGTLTIAQSSDIDTMDPAMHRSRINENVVRNVFDALVNQDQSLKPVPELATSWEQVSPTQWRFHLRPGVKFQNGEPFNAGAVKFSIERVLDPKQASPRASLLSMISAVTAEDDNTVLIDTDGPAPTLLAELSVNEIVPPDYVKKVGDAEFAKKPVGTGPFKFQEWVPNERVVLKANDDYWGGRPKVDTMVFKPIPEDSARIAAVQSGDVQIAAEIPADLAKSLTGNVTAKSVRGTRIFFLAMNVTKPPFDQTPVREAVNKAIDRDTIVKTIYQGFARPLNQPAFPEMVGYDKGFQGYPYDKQAASQVLQGLGPVSIDVSEANKTLAQAVAGQLQAAGMTVAVNVLEDQAFDDATEKGASQAYIDSWGVAEGDADVIFERHFWSPARKDAFYTGYANPRLDELIQRGRSTESGQERESIYAEATTQVMADAPWAPLVNPDEIYGVSTSVHGWEPSPIGRFNATRVTLG
jgi:peptide/nickel transport system substrate-binding protein